MTVSERKEAETLLRKYDVRTLAPLAVSCGMIRVLKEKENEMETQRQKNQLSFNWDKDKN